MPFVFPYLFYYFFFIIIIFIFFVHRTISMLVIIHSHMLINHIPNRWFYVSKNVKYSRNRRCYYKLILCLQKRQSTFFDDLNVSFASLQLKNKQKHENLTKLANANRKNNMHLIMLKWMRFISSSLTTK